MFKGLRLSHRDADYCFLGGYAVSTGEQFLKFRSFETSVSIYPSTKRNTPKDLKVSFEVPVGKMAILKQVVREVTYRSSHTLLCLFSGISSFVRFYIISFFYFFFSVFTHPTFHLLVAWLLETL